MNYVYDYSKLLGRLRELSITQSELAKKLEISETSLNKKLKGNSQFKQEEIRTIIDVIQMSIDDVATIFFSKKTCENTSCIKGEN